MKEGIKAKLYCKFSNNLFTSGHSDTKLIFYNEGGKESIVYIDDIEIHNLECHWIIPPDNVEFITIKPHSPLEINVKSHYKVKKEPVNKQFISSINKIQLKYHWIKTKRNIPCTEEVPISFEIIELSVKPQTF